MCAFAKANSLATVLVLDRGSWLIRGVRRWSWRRGAEQRLLLLQGVLQARASGQLVRRRIGPQRPISVRSQVDLEPLSLLNLTARIDVNKSGPSFRFGSNDPRGGVSYG